MQGNEVLLLQGNEVLLLQGNEVLLLQGKEVLLLQGNEVLLLQGDEVLLLQGNECCCKEMRYFCFKVLYVIIVEKIICLSQRNETHWGKLHTCNLNNSLLLILLWSLSSLSLSRFQMQSYLNKHSTKD